MNFFRQLITIVTWPIRMLVALPVRIVSAPRRLMGMSLPTRVAVVLAVFLVLITIGVSIAKYLGSDDLANFWDTWVVSKGPAVLVLLIVLPLIVHRAVKLWLEGDVSKFPDLDHAWREGLKALAQNGIDLTNVPVFLVVGVRDDRQAKSLFDASQRSLSITGVPQGKVPFQWYGDQDAVFLVCTEISCLGLVNRRGEQMAGAAAAAPPPSLANTMAPQLGGTIVASSPTGDARETALPVPGRQTQPAPSSGPSLAGTMVLNSGGDGGIGQTLVPGGSTPGLAPTESGEMTERLAYLCRQLKRARQPLCPANGVLAVLPFDVIQRASADVEVQRATLADLQTLRRSLQMRCPAVALLSGMEEESGFRELVRRVGVERARAQRFGKGFNVWNEPSEEQVEAVCAHACKAFEDWAYLLFREKDGLTRPGNRKLYALLCKIRTEFHKRLKNIVVGAFADNRGLDATRLEPLLFGGCYFAAIGETEDRQAFVKSVFDKLVQSEEELEWGQEAIREDEWYHLWTQALLVFDGLLLIAIGGLTAYLWMRGQT